MMANFGAYIHFKPDGTPFYVGKGRVERAKRLDASHHNAHHARVVAKYGKDTIGIAFIPCSSEKIAFELEIGLIKCLKRSNITLANITEGGEGVSGPKSLAHKQKISAALKGRKIWCEGKKLSAEHRARISIGHKGIPSHRKGKKVSEESVKRMRDSANAYWESLENRQKQRDAAKSQMKPVVACGVEFESMHAFCLYTNKALSTVARWRKNNMQDKIDHAYLEVINDF